MPTPPSCQLLGPPELHDKPVKKASSSSSSASGDPFMDLMVANFNKRKVPPPPTRGYTENGSATFLSTSNPCLDFFFHIVPSTPADSITERLQLAWNHNDLTTLKLICHLRGVRGTGKSDKEGFYTAALWLHKHHPKTLACNVKSIAKFGYFKDLPEILYRILEGSEVRKVAKEEFQRRSRKKPRMPKKEVAKAKKAFERYSRDPDFRFLHDQISQAFADYLIADLKSLNSGETGKISLAAKWCPSLDSAFDKSILLCESIARRVFTRDSYPEYEGIEEAHYAFRVRDRLRKQVLVPLRQILELPEVYMSSNMWNTLPYGRVPSVAMTNYKKHFLKHDEERFNDFLSKVASGEAKIAAGALLPHEIITRVEKHESDGGVVAELQWKRMVNDLSAKGKLKNCIAVCDVSGSMAGTPMDVAVALGLLLSELCEHPWKGRVITFSADPQLHIIQGDDLRSKAQSIKKMQWGMNTNFQKVFDMILQVAKAGNLSTDKMIKKVFVFSDMEFDAARRQQDNSWNTDYEVIQQKFQKSGYTVPEIVFWNLRDSEATPVASDQKGVALVSGFAKNMMTLFFNEEDIIAPSPEAVMEMALEGPEYQQLAVLD
ncbi:hypothetical protein AQUCO_01600088v1 [Aquilegia coerulea]|uniref:TROVE domain-containing protein n=1 Tax=Aquilegia coerulea TaxID=218851 RepID=A0A2G5DQ28_AQUCA|nr:hypothetical protein AQUCO_01600088v1 [Aquilegia coerulea]